MLLCLLRILVLCTLAVFSVEPYSCDLRHDTHNYSLERLRLRGNYNLDPLSDQKSYHAVEINQTLTVILAVCQSLFGWDKYEACGASNIAICLVDQSDRSNIRYTSLGVINEEDGIAIAVDGSIKIHYENGATCGTNKLRHLRSTIKFICDLNAKEGYAEYAGGLESCDVVFVWKTAAACSEKTLVDSSLGASQVCQVTDPISGYTYDFSQLHKIITYALAVPDAVSALMAPMGGPFGNASRVCKISTYDESSYMKLGGVANSHLSWSPRTGLNWYSNYYQRTGDHLRNITIKFVCRFLIVDDIFHDYNLAYVSEYEGRRYAVIATSQACPKVCVSFRHREIYRSLMGSAIGHKIKHDNRVYSFDMYRSDLQENIDCTDAVPGILMTSHQSDGSISYYRLGLSDVIPTVTGERISMLKFMHGNPCIYGPYGQIIFLSSQISFICDVGVAKSLPEFVRNDSYTHYLEWRSRQNCGIVDCTTNANCSIENELGHRWNLMPLREKFVHSVASIRSNSTYDIQICGRNNATNESSIFTKETNFGKLFKVSTDYAKNMSLKLYFSHGTKCANGSSNARSVLYLLCDEARDIGEPEILWEEECSVGFEWRTRLVCFPEIRISQPSVSSWLSATTLIFGLLILLIAVVGVVLLSRNAVAYKTLATNVRNYGSCGY